MSTHAEAYGQRLRTARLAAGLTQTELAEALDLTRSSVANVEAGRQPQTVEQALRAADALGCDPRWLTTGWTHGDPARMVDAAQHAVRNTLTEIRATLDALEAGLR